VFAKRTGLPVKWTSTRTEDLVETAPGRDSFCDIELACDQDGKLVALKANIEADAGVTGTLSVLVGLTLRLLPGAYKIPNLDLKATVYATNKAATGPVRGAGRPEACCYIERAVDLLAKKMGLDPLEFRRRNILLPEDFPYDNGAGFVYDSANYPLLLDTLEKQGHYYDLESWKNRVREDYVEKKRPLVAGVGLCAEVEDTGSQFTETARLVFEKSGNLTLYTGSSPHGQGLETSLAQLVSEEMEVPLENIHVIYGDTELIPSGIGTFGSRSIVTGGSAAVEASRKLKSLAVQKAAEILNAPEVDLRFSGSIIGKNSDSHFRLTVPELLQKLNLTELSVSTEFKMSAPTFASAAHLCALTLDVESGKIKIERYVAVDDVGRIINNAIVDGQIEGGVIHGVGGSLYEQMVFNEEGALLTSNLVDYLIPTSLDSPNIELFHVETPSTLTLNGAKGAGEGGTIAAYPAVINAVNDALAQLDPKLKLNMVPATPEEVVATIKKNLQGP
jgi:carbon-monoxide dehydrogenase large subunit